MDSMVIRNTKIVYPDAVKEGFSVVCRGGRIESILPAGREKAPPDHVVDAMGAYLSPGFIDIHIHGVLGHRTDEGGDSVTAMDQLLPRYGVTGWLPTLTPNPQLSGWISRLVRTEETKESGILGFHMEGPFLSLTGALPPETLGMGGSELISSLMEAALPYPVFFSVSPEYPGILDLLPEMKHPVFMTHTAATVEQTRSAIEAGVRHATHFYDVFPHPDEKDPGVRPCGAVEAVLADPRVSVDFVLDGEHVDPVAVEMALACKAPDRVCLITDANTGAGMPPGSYKGLGNREIHYAYPGAPARFTEGDHQAGALVGSGLTMDQAVRNALRFLDIDLPLAVRMASANPARVLGIEDKKGCIREGADADLVLLDENLEVLRTWIAGCEVYRRHD